MILTKKNLANNHLRIYANLNGFKVGDEIENVGYSSFISKKVELFRDCLIEKKRREIERAKK